MHFLKVCITFLDEIGQYLKKEATMVNSIELIYTCFILLIGLLNTLNADNISADNKFVKDETLKGYKCLDENVIFKMTRGKQACAIMCWMDLACSSIIYSPDSGKCTGCSSFTGANDPTQADSVFYKRACKLLFFWKKNLAADDI